MTDPRNRPEDDPTRVRNQPALQTSTGAIWIVTGAIMSAVVIAVLVPMLALNAMIAGVGIGLVVLLFLGLLVARFRIGAGRARLAMMASLFVGIAVVGLLAVFLVSSIQAESLR
ncbi:hypothetical protein [Mycetocola zhujimingii]|uniref:Uncharacterized protein n=1 Tax=Mycetocola zhujimingii TaxID=2079792 RepID=A0A2U1THN7_9MICO|nr:hypothetical protein [Mycetocola zhujimingii]AWB86828.1 hypothetical protein C3E77_09485 [Mycetocola zhujimingii]PWC08376.1 hypothetical protein DF223_03305 [Mycetocola zhujimingii]